MCTPIQYGGLTKSFKTTLLRRAIEFSSKINFVYRFGLIDSDLARALHLVRRIRNSFAHEVSGCSLTSGAHSDRVRELARPLKILPFYSKFTEAFFWQ